MSKWAGGRAGQRGCVGGWVRGRVAVPRWFMDSVRGGHGQDGWRAGREGGWVVGPKNGWWVGGCVGGRAEWWWWAAMGGRPIVPVCGARLRSSVLADPLGGSSWSALGVGRLGRTC